LSLSDRRRHPRFPFHTRATVRLDACEFSGTLVDISLAGALFAGHAETRSKIGEPCNLKVFHGARPDVTIAGAVIHAREHLVGIEFSSVDEAVAKALRHMVELNLGMPRLLSRDIAALLRHGT
jgi:hypothetical protein